MRRFERTTTTAITIGIPCVAALLLMTSACGGKARTNASSDSQAGTPARDSGSDGPGVIVDSGTDGNSPARDADGVNGDSGIDDSGNEDGGSAEGGGGGGSVVDGGDSGTGTGLDGGIADSGTGATDGGRVTGYPEGEGPVWEEGARACHSHPYDQHPCPANQWCYPGRVPSCAALGACVDRPNPALCLDICPGVCGLLPGLIENFYCNDCLANADGACVVNDGPC